MEDLIYGYWDGVVYDNRRRFDGDAPRLDPEELLFFNRGNPITSFVAPQGFLVFDNRITLAQVLHQYYKKTRALSCGRCTPCRMGSILILRALREAIQGRGRSVDWDRIKLVAKNMRETSLCGVGETTPEAIIGAIEYYPELLRDAPPAVRMQHDYYSLATAPCIEACPANVNIPRYIDYIRDGHPDLACATLLKDYPLVGSCGRVCVRPCEAACVRNQVDKAVAIKDLKRYAADHVGAPIETLFIHEEKPEVTPVSARVAVIGAGPAGINCAYHLLRRGHQVDIFEREQQAGGMALLGIPSYRLPNQLLKSETEAIERLGGQYYFGQALGRDFTIDTLFKRGYRAVFLGIGCALGNDLGLPNEDTTLEGYHRGLDFLLDIYHGQETGQMPRMDGNVVVLGCGNVAMDCCRSARRLAKGKTKITVAYRRTEASAPADPEEIKAAKGEEIDFEFLTAPVEVLSENHKVTGIRMIRMQEGEPDASGRRRVTPIEGSEFVIPCDHVIAAIGQKMETSIFCEEDGIRFNRRGGILVNEALATSRVGVFAGGDAAAGPTSLICGMAEGKTAAASIHEYLMSESTGFLPRQRMSKIIQKLHLLDTTKARIGVPKQERFEVKHLAPSERMHNWKEVEFPMKNSEAWEEAKRCMRCYRLYAVSTLRPIPGKTALEEI